jgi:hypothetical protein
MKTWTYTVPPWDTSTGSVLDRVWLNPSKLRIEQVKPELRTWCHVMLTFPVIKQIREPIEGPIRREL